MQQPERDNVAVRQARADELQGALGFALDRARQVHRAAAGCTCLRLPRAAIKARHVRGQPPRAITPTRQDAVDRLDTLRCRGNRDPAGRPDLVLKREVDVVCVRITRNSKAQQEGRIERDGLVGTPNGGIGILSGVPPVRGLVAVVRAESEMPLGQGHRLCPSSRRIPASIGYSATPGRSGRYIVPT